MADLKTILENRMVWIKGPLPENEMFLKCAQVEEGLSQITEITAEFLSPDKALDLNKVVGKPISVGLEAEEEAQRSFHGVCVEASYIGLYEGYGQYTLQVRPWLWFLTRKRNNRIFQEMNADQIISKIFEDTGFSSEVTKKMSRSFTVREYTVQYAETDYDFIMRLMEEEGIYYFFDHEGSSEKLVLADHSGAHIPVPGASSIDFNYREPEYRRKKDHIFEWHGGDNVVPGKVSLDDYDFKVPSAVLATMSAIPKGSHSHKDYEHYDYPGRYREASLGEHFAKVRMEAHAAQFKLWHGVGNVRTMAVGQTFSLKKHPRASENGDYLITKARHQMQIESDYEEEESLKPLLKDRIEFDEDNKDTYRCSFEVMPKAEQYRAPIVTHWPVIPGIQTADVVGPDGEEIYTDEFGRIKVQFRWDREGQSDENSSCWIRVVFPWVGKNWGMVAIPRIGQEVVIQFEEGNPDRPICTGMLYNADTMPPYTLPDNMTMMGMKSNKSKDGGGFNEFVMEDKAEEEYVRLQSERDYVEIIKNNAEITIGMEHMDPGDLTQTIYHDKTETIKTGDHTFCVEEGSQTIGIKVDKAETIEGKSDLTICGDLTELVEQGDISRQAQTGKITVEAMQSIELKCGGSSLKIDPMKIELKAMTIKIKADIMAEMKGGATAKVQGGAMVTIKGGMVMIN
jgi:type VI secretion system secreted protein VgrG